MAAALNTAERHHIWCNGQRGPVSTCRWCGGNDGLHALYPMDGLTADELQKKHFPDAIKREGT